MTRKNLFFIFFALFLLPSASFSEELEQKTSVLIKNEAFKQITLELWSLGIEKKAKSSDKKGR